MEKQNTSRWKNRFVNLSVTMGTLLVLFIIYLLVFDSYRKGLKAYRIYSKSTSVKKGIAPMRATDAVQLGRVHTSGNQPQSSYLQFQQEKSAGKIRIGIFGCSFVRGIGAGFGYDFPTRLQEKYKQAGRDEVEVINFGVGMYGMNRSFYMWNCLGKSYDLDIVIFNIHDFHQPRDRTFIFYPDAYGDVHGRYILDEGQLRYIPVLGENSAETSAKYYAPIPAWRYWKYEAKSPPPLRVLLPKGRSLKTNPFYYHPDPQQEWKLLYAAIFDSVARSVPRLILTCGDQKTLEFTHHLSAENIEICPLKAHEIRLESQWVYNASNSHPSAMNFQLIGEEMFDYLEKDSIARQIPVLSYDRSPLMSAGFQSNAGRLADIERLYLGIGGEEVSIFLPATHRMAGNPITNPFIDFGQLGIEALMALHLDNQFYILPLDHLLDKNAEKKMKVRLQMEDHEKVFELTGFTPFSHLWSIVDSLKSSYQVEGLEVSLSNDNNDLKMRIKSPQDISAVHIEIDGKPVISGKKTWAKNQNYAFTLKPVLGEWIVLRGDMDQKIDIHKIPSSGYIDLVSEYKTGEVKSLPCMRYVIDQVLVSVTSLTF